MRCCLTWCACCPSANPMPSWMHPCCPGAAQVLHSIPPASLPLTGVPVPATSALRGQVQQVP